MQIHGPYANVILKMTEINLVLEELEKSLDPEMNKPSSLAILSDLEDVKNRLENIIKTVK